MIIGMDFGTTNSGMAAYDGDRLTLIPLDPANPNPHVARSALYITNDGYVHLGQSATDTYYEQNLNRPSQVERVRVGEIEMTFAEIGTFIRDVFIDKDIYSPGRLFLSFKMGLSSPNYLGTIVGNQYFFLEDIIATYLYVTKRRAEMHLNCEIDTIVLGRPVRFSDDPEHNAFAKERLLQAAFNAGYKTVYLQFEPIAAAHYYETTIADEQNVLVFDFGGGTLDMSIVRLGNPETRAVIANSGIPIAGDVFDQRIVRAKYPAHFGEGSHYRSGNTQLPIPSTFYESFADWQTLLTLQLPHTMETLRRIRGTADQPYKVNALIELITGHYGLKMFDVAEDAKRHLSERLVARLDMAGEGFTVRDSIKRSEFERLIRSDARAISQRLDDILTEANMTPNDIDAVIRTGGSAQIPLFIQLLEDRFGAEKLLNIDAFSSVTAGLGIIAHQIETEQGEFPAYHAASYSGTSTLFEDTQTRVPRIDIDLLKRIVDAQDRQQTTQDNTCALITRGSNQRLIVVSAENMLDAPQELPELDERPFFLVAPNTQKVVLLTTDFQAYVKSVTDLWALYEGGLAFEALEGFRSDVFSDEYIYAVEPWENLIGSDYVIAISSLGYVQKFIGERVLEKMDRPIAYQMAKMRGYPACLTGANAGDDYVAVTHAGRAGRIRIDDLSYRTTRLLSLSLKGYVVGTVATNTAKEIIVATKSGYARRLHIEDIPYVTDMNTTGSKIMQRSNTVSAIAYAEDQDVWALTTKRICPIDAYAIPVEDSPTTKHKALEMSRGERLIALFSQTPVPITT